MLGNVGTSKFSRLWDVAFVDFLAFVGEETMVLLVLDASVSGECVGGILRSFGGLLCVIGLPNAAPDWTFHRPAYLGGLKPI